MIRILQSTLILTILLLSISACEKKPQQQASPDLLVTVSKPTVKDVTEYLYFTGNTQSPQTVEFRARVSGTLTKIYFKDGDLVKAGDPLFEIEPDTYAAKLALADSAIKGAQAELLRATVEYARQSEMVKQSATSMSDVDKWRAQRDSAQAALDEAKSNYDLAKIQFGYTKIVAPFDGRMDRSMVDLGNLVGASEATQLSVIRKIDPMYAYFNINEKDLARVRTIRLQDADQAANTNRTSAVVELATEGDTDYTMKGLFDFGATSVDPSTGSLLLRATFDNPRTGNIPKLITGMYVRLRVPIQIIKNAILVPERILGVNQDSRFALVVNDQGIAEQRPLQVGPLDGDMRVISSGLSADDWVIVAGGQRVRPGMKVNTQKK